MEYGVEVSLTIWELTQLGDFRKIELHTDNKKVFQAINKNAIKINAKKGVL